MSKQAKANDNFSLEVLGVLRSERLDDKNRVELRVVKYARSETPGFEKVRIWERSDGERAKRLLLEADDIRFVYEKYPEIINLL